MIASALLGKNWMQNHVISYNIKNKCMVILFFFFFYVGNQCIKVHTEDDISSYLLCGIRTHHICYVV